MANSSTINLEFSFVNSSWVCTLGLNSPVLFSDWCKSHGLSFDPTLSYCRGWTSTLGYYVIHFKPLLIAVKYVAD